MTPVRFIDVEEVRDAVTVADLVEPMLAAYAETSAGRTENRISVIHPGATRDAGDVHIRTGTVSGKPVHIVKIAPWFRSNYDRRLPQGGLIVVLDSVTGYARAIIDDRHLLTDLRTAAASAAAVELLCHDDVDQVTVLGTGVQARLQPPAIFRQRPFRRLCVWGRDTRRAREAARRLRADLPEVRIDVVSDRRTALATADLVITATAATSAIVESGDIPRCRYIAAVGADDPDKCELDAAVLRRAEVFVDDVVLSTENGSVHRAISDNAYSADLLAGEIGDVVRGTHPGRSNEAALVVAGHVGIGAQDVFAAEALLEKLQAQ